MLLDVINYMANTFKALCEHADWSNLSVSQFEKQESSSKQEESYIEKSNNQKRMSLHYNIQIHLPETTNMAVYDAIFQSLKKHLA